MTRAEIPQDDLTRLSAMVHAVADLCRSVSEAHGTHVRVDAVLSAMNRAGRVPGMRSSAESRHSA